MTNINIINIKIKDSSIKELAEILELEKVCFNSPWSYDMYFSCIKKTYTILKHITYENKIIGFILCEIIYDELNLLKIAIHPLYRKQGLALLLVKDLFKNIKINNIYLEVSVNNIAAINFYTKLGFKTINVRKKYYSNGDDANIMLCTYENIIKRFDDDTRY